MALHWPPTNRVARRHAKQQLLSLCAQYVPGRGPRGFLVCGTGGNGTGERRAFWARCLDLVRTPAPRRVCEALISHPSSTHTASIPRSSREASCGHWTQPAGSGSVANMVIVSEQWAGLWWCEMVWRVKGAPPPALHLIIPSQATHNALGMPALLCSLFP